MDLFVARQPATQTTRKAVLLEACTAAGVEPRPNWVHPNPREFQQQLELLAEVHMLQVGEPLPNPLMPGAKTTYTTAKSWPVTDSTTGECFVITWDSLTGEVHGNVKGARWRGFADAMPDAIDRAYETAEVIHNNVIDQIAVALMLSFPCAPFVSSGLPGKQRNSLWIAVPVECQMEVEIFFSELGRPLLDCMTISNGPSSATRQRVADSCARGCKRLVRGSGYRKICMATHQSLLDLML